MFNKIDVEQWNRKESFLHYSHTIPCTYSMTVNVDITHFLSQIKTSNTPFFPSMLYALSSIVNKHTEFRMDIDEDGSIGYYDFLNPCYAVFHKDTETITNVWTEQNSSLPVFLENYHTDMAQYGQKAKESKPLNGKNYFNVSCIPWTSFTGFNLNLQKGYDYLLPIFTMGKYYGENKKTLLPLAIQVHHAVCDGFHLSRFINELQDFLNVFNIES